MAVRYDAGELITAMVTPFKENGDVDYDSLEKLVNHLINNGSDAILVAGTTGECPTLTHEEEWEVLKFVLKAVDGRVKVVMGTGAAVDVAIMNKCISIIRGLRGLSDYDYEVQLRQINKEISNNQINTVCLLIKSINLYHRVW